MDVRLDLKNMHGTVDAISSKSHAHRALIAAALSDRETVLHLNSTSKDIEATAECLKAAGADITKSGNDLRVSPIKELPREAVFDCSESGSTIRFLIPAASALGISSTFTGSGRLPERPLGPLLDAMRQHGVTVSENGVFPVTLSGRLTSGIFEIAGNISSQFVTGLLFALPLLSGDSEIRLIPPVESKPYIDLTVSVLKKFGINIQQDGNSFFIKGGQKYISPLDITIDGDWSNGAFFAAFGALSDFTVNGLYADSVQGDKEIMSIVKKMGAETVFGKDKVRISKSKLNAVEIDAKNIPDLVPVTAALSVFANGKTVIFNAERLKIKESDRLSSVHTLISAAGGRVQKTNDGLIIDGGYPVKECFTVDAMNDHRIVMAAAVLASHSRVTVKNAQAINKSYPDFFEHLKMNGGICDVINDG